MHRSLILFLLAVMVYGCVPVANQNFIQFSDIEIPIPEKSPESGSACHDQLNYIPDTNHIDHTPFRVVLVNFHVMRKGDGTGHFTEKEMPGYVEQLLENTNMRLLKNDKMHLPLDNNIPVLPTRYKFELYKDPNDPKDNGIFFHNDDDLFYFVKQGKNRNNYIRHQFDKYGNHKGKVLNIFIMPHHPDSVISPSYRPTVTGIAFHDHVKIAGMYHYSRDTTWNDGKPFVKGAWYCHGIMNHELGHTLGLRHTWRGNDGCDDTPNHTNCYAKGKTPPCDKEWSNNVMDYNTHQNSWTPCQIGAIHWKFSQLNSQQRKFLKPTWCELNKDRTIVIKDNVTWRGAKDLEGHLIIAQNGTLTIECRVSLPQNAIISIRPGGKLILDGATIDNTCGGQWQGIEIWKEGNTKGQVVFRNDPQLLNMKTALK